MWLDFLSTYHQRRTVKHASNLQEGLPIRYDLSHAEASLDNAVWLWQFRYGRPSSVSQDGKYAMKHSAVVACDVSTLMLRKQTKRETGGSYSYRTIYVAIE